MHQPAGPSRPVVDMPAGVSLGAGRRTPLVLGPRVLLVLAVACYVTAFNVTYRDLVSPVFDFWGLGYNPPPAPYFWASVVVSILPAVWMPISFRRPSLFLFYLQYFLMYIPACFIVYHNSRPTLPLDDAAKVVATMFAGISIMQWIYWFPLRPIRVSRLSPGVFWTVFCAFLVTMVAYLAATLMSNFRIANFQEIYSVRFAMVDTLRATGSRFGFYAQTLLTSLFLPILFALGIKARRRSLLVPALLGYVFLFGIGGTKATILALAYLPLGALLFSRRPQHIGLALLLGLTSLLLAGYATAAVFPRKAHVAFVAVAHFRMFSVPAQMIPQYVDFFRDHPVTHLSHVSGISQLVHYPYDTDVPYTLGYYYYRATIGLNANFWASDGIGGFGVWGIIPMCILCAAIFWLLDAATKDLDPRFVALGLTYCAFSLGSVSLFTTLISGGLAFQIVIGLLAPRAVDGTFALPFPAHRRRTVAVAS